MNKKELWLRLRQYRFTHLVPPSLWGRLRDRFGGAAASEAAFAHKLSRKLGWTRRFALEAILEYKKYIYLGVISEHTVTPPKIIDQVWHEHLLFSNGYRQFCSEVIHYDFDHYPELFDDVEQTGVFSAQYAFTCQLYASEFGNPPPEHIWGQPKFNETIAAGSFQPTKKSGDVVLSYYSEQPLYSYFEGTPLETNFSGFGEGDAGGGGAGSTWGSHAGADASGSDGGDGGSSCSSGCSGCGGD